MSELKTYITVDIKEKEIFNISLSQGLKGITGATGLQGPIGNKGPIGDQGPVGNKGPIGNQGLPGLDSTADDLATEDTGVTIQDALNALEVNSHAPNSDNQVGDGITITGTGTALDPFVSASNGAVDSVNGKIGDVDLVADDILTDESGVSVQDKLDELESSGGSVSSVNNKTGDVDLVADDIPTDESEVSVQDSLDSKYDNNTPNQYTQIASKNPLVDGDITIFEDSESNPQYTKRSVFWSTIKSTLKTYFDAIYSIFQTADDIPTSETGVSVQDKLDELESSGGSVLSVNDKIGDVDLSASDIPTDETGVSVQDELNSLSSFNGGTVTEDIEIVKINPELKLTDENDNSVKINKSSTDDTANIKNTVRVMTEEDLSSIYTSYYPPIQNSTYVKTTTELTAGWSGYVATNPATLLDGAREQMYISAGGAVANQRFHIDLGSAKIINNIYYENQHNAGGSLTEGANHFTFWGSNDSDDFDDLTYANDGTWVQLTTDVSQFEQHVGANTPDPKYVVVTNTTAYRYYAIKIADNWGDATFVGIRRIELRTQGLPATYEYQEVQIVKSVKSDTVLLQKGINTFGDENADTIIKGKTITGLLASGISTDETGVSVQDALDNPVFTSDIEISKSVPELKLTDEEGISARINKNSTNNEFNIVNKIKIMTEEDNIESSTSQYPPEYNHTYVKTTSELTGTYGGYTATDPSTPLIGGWDDRYISAGGVVANQRFHIDLGSAKIINNIYYENQHNAGGFLTVGANHFTLWGSNTESDFLDLIYINDGTWVQLTTDVSQFEQHVGANTPDPKYVVVTNTTAYRYYAIKIADNWGDATFVGIRRIELQIYIAPGDVFEYQDVQIVKSVKSDTVLLQKGINTFGDENADTIIKGKTITGLLASGISTDETGVSVQDKLDELESSGGSVSSVNNKTGEVDLVADDIPTDETGVSVQDKLDALDNITGSWNSNQDIEIEKSDPKITLIDINTGLTSIHEKIGSNSQYSIKNQITKEITYTSQSIPEDNDTYVKATSFYYNGNNTYLTTKQNTSLTGEWYNNAWLTISATGNQRFHIDLGSEKLIARIYYENLHNSGTESKSGAKDFTLWGSNTESDFLDLTYVNDGTWTQITTDISQLTQHPADDISDPHFINIINAATYRYYAFKFANNWGGGYIGVRRIELQISNGTTHEIEIIKSVDSDTTFGDENVDTIIKGKTITGLLASGISTDETGVSVQDSLDSKYDNNTPNQYTQIASKNPLVDGDITIFEDSESNPQYTKRSVFWSTIKSTLKTYFDAIYSIFKTASDIPTDETGVSVQDALDNKPTLIEVKADSDISDSIIKKHTQNTDKDIILDGALSDTTVSGIKINLYATDDFVFGEVGYIDSNGKVSKADATIIGTATALVICAESSISGDSGSLEGSFLLQGIAKDDNWNWTPGGIIYLNIIATGETQLTQTAPTETDEVVQILGVAISTTIIYWNPQLTQIELV